MLIMTLVVRTFLYLEIMSSINKIKILDLMSYLLSIFQAIMLPQYPQIIMKLIILEIDNFFHLKMLIYYQESLPHL